VVVVSCERPVLIVTEPLDVHADFVLSELNKRDVPVFRFHTEDFPVGSQISISGAGTVWSGDTAAFAALGGCARGVAAAARRPGR
jgi:hypothetical protein